MMNKRGVIFIVLRLGRASPPHRQTSKERALDGGLWKQPGTATWQLSPRPIDSTRELRRCLPGRTSLSLYLGCHQNPAYRVDWRRGREVPHPGTHLLEPESSPYRVCPGFWHGE